MSSEGTGRVPLRPLPQGSRYELLLRIAAGGMATVYLGRLKASAGFWKLRAIKRAHPHLVEDGELRRYMIEEANVCSRIDHPNVVAMQDVEELQGELLLIMDYVEGASAVDLVRYHVEDGVAVPPPVAIRIVLDAAAGLRAAHDLNDENGEPMGLVHRDVSPQNILLGTDGIAKVADFGIAKAMLGSGSARTMTGGLRGKVGYMSPEYVNGKGLDKRADIFALGIVLWEMLCGRRLFRGANELATLQQVAREEAAVLSKAGPDLGDGLDHVVARSLNKAPSARFQTMGDFATALQEAAAAADVLGTHEQVAALLEKTFGPRLERRREKIKEVLEVLDGPPKPPQTKPPDSGRTAVLEVPAGALLADAVAPAQAAPAEPSAEPELTVTKAQARPSRPAPPSTIVLPSAPAQERAMRPTEQLDVAAVTQAMQRRAHGQPQRLPAAPTAVLPPTPEPAAGSQPTTPAHRRQRQMTGPLPPVVSSRPVPIPADGTLDPAYVPAAKRPTAVIWLVAASAGCLLLALLWFGVSRTADADPPDTPTPATSTSPSHGGDVDEPADPNEPAVAPSAQVPTAGVEVSGAGGQDLPLAAAGGSAAQSPSPKPTSGVTRPPAAPIPPRPRPPRPAPKRPDPNPYLKQ